VLVVLMLVVLVVLVLVVLVLVVLVLVVLLLVPLPLIVRGAGLHNLQRGPEAGFADSRTDQPHSVILPRKSFETQSARSV
jgi:hypothetical protein